MNKLTEVNNSQSKTKLTRANQYAGQLLAPTETDWNNQVMKLFKGANICGCMPGWKVNMY